MRSSVAIAAQSILADPLRAPAPCSWFGTEPVATGESVIDDIHITVDVDELRENLPATADERTVRVYAGYSGWGPDQLDREIAAGAWQVAPASADQVFTREPVQLWREVHRVASEISLVGLPVIRYRGRCASRVARNSLFSFQAGQVVPGGQSRAHPVKERQILNRARQVPVRLHFV